MTGGVFYQNAADSHMSATLFQIPVGPDVVVVLLALLMIVGVLLGIAVIAVVWYRRRQAADETDTTDRVAEIE
ncbi:hypothetical protein [Halohasta salina]|uniref:hypothetical protein n=1 Tax=Halohasta salina TaxID=2961621 RepID=UPI0020A52195|nr:hypothetical protein [Halohasta salina]